MDHGRERGRVEWLIVGGGPHGLHMAIRLLEAGVTSEAIRILDPHGEPLARWNGVTRNTGMSFLRSPQVHNLGVESLGLEEVAESDEYRVAKRRAFGASADAQPDFIAPYERPSLDLFRHHAEGLIEAYEIRGLWIKGRATFLQRTEFGYEIELDSGEVLASRNVVLALGSSDSLRRPDWAIELKSRCRDAPLHHILEPSFDRMAVGASDDVVLIGAGVSSVQLALSLAKVNPQRRITLLTRHSLRQSDFESDPGWLGPLYLAEFDAQPCVLKRRAMIDEARQFGSLATDVMQDITRALRAGHVEFMLAEVDGANSEGARRGIELDVRRFELDEEVYHRTGDIISRKSESIRPISADHVLLGTGFEPSCPGGDLVSRAIAALDLPLAPDGFPVVDECLRWRPGLFVMGPLAELMVGPASRNLSGARMAALRILESSELQEYTSGSALRL